MEIKDSNGIPPYYLDLAWFEKIKGRYAITILDEYLVAQEAISYSESLDEIRQEYALTWHWYDEKGLHGMYLGATNAEGLQEINAIYRVYVRMDR